MPDIDISSGATETIINQRQANLTIDDHSKVQHYIIDVSGDPIRIALEEEKEQARHGFPIPAGSTLTIDSKGEPIVAYGDGAGTSTVNVQMMKFVIGEFDS